MVSRSCQEIECQYDPNLEIAWKEGRLPEKLFQQYSDLFEMNKDMKHYVQVSPGHYFGECLAAIHYHEQGYKVLIETYLPHGGNKVDSEKRKQLAAVVGDGAFGFLNTLASPQGTGLPDLFVYSDAKYFFVEVKVKGDSLSKTQKELYGKLGEQLPGKVIIMRLKPRPRKLGPRGGVLPSDLMPKTQDRILDCPDQSSDVADQVAKV